MAPTTEPDVHQARLANGVRVLVIRLPQLETACASVFVRTGSAHESRALNGISHVVEHMVFKGTATRDARRINVDAERLGAEVNAHTDKDHTAFHMRGLAADAPAFVSMLGDIVSGASFPAAELERERQVLLHECTEDEDDPVSTAFKLFDKACFGAHGAAQAVIGPRRNIERFSRDELVAWVGARYSGANLVVGVAGNVEPGALVRAAEAAFGGLASGQENRVEPARYLGGIASKRDAGSSQAHLVLGFPLPPLADDDYGGEVAAALFGEGMSSPLLDQIRERRGLAYYSACSADVLDVCGQFVIEASTGPKQIDELLTEVLRLLAAQAEAIDPLDLERARRQLAVRRLRDHERPHRRLEDAALDLMFLGRVRPAAERRERIEALGSGDLRAVFERMLAAGVSVALAGELPRAASERVREIIARSGYRVRLPQP
ncbi:MAG: insulinase family protein [Burkholderiales bacterium]|nr:insulinase family protein [Burkholderiales bacterium]MDE2395402.1 insulinase family protein [Burkholderiales bacterium]MDE2452705.1 insulinase family protein [Burkholderiales bacterium]